MIGHVDADCFYVSAERVRYRTSRVGRFALRSGSTLPLVDVYGDAANEYDICDIYGKSCF